MPSGHCWLRQHNPPSRSLRDPRSALERTGSRGRGLAAAPAGRRSRRRLLEVGGKDVLIGSGGGVRLVQRAVPLRHIHAELRRRSVGLLAQRMRAQSVHDGRQPLYASLRVEHRRHANPGQYDSSRRSYQSAHGRWPRLGKRSVGMAHTRAKGPAECHHRLLA